MKRLVLSLLAAGFLAAPVLAGVTPAPATPAATQVPATGKAAPVKKNPSRIASVKKSTHRHKHHTAASKTTAAPATK